jgi:hypothetical protein
MVHFNSSDTSEAGDPEASESEQSKSKLEDDTARVNELLQSMEQAITSAAYKFASLPSTPQLQESLLPRIFRQPSPETKQVPTSPVSKGKQPTPPPPLRATSSGLFNPTQTHTVAQKTVPMFCHFGKTDLA